MAKSREAFRTISEVAEWLDVKTHVLRFWESKFSQVKPVKRAGGRRYYRPQDMELLGGLKKLLHEDGMPIKDAQQLLREKGVKHVSSLSRPVDQEDQSVEAVAEDLSEETAQEPIETPQQEPQVDLQPDEALESEPAQEEPVEAKDEDIEDAAEADEPLEYVAEEEAIAAPEDTHEEVSEETLYTAPDDVDQDDETSIEVDEEDDNAGIPEDLLVKIEGDVPATSSEPGPMPSGLTSPAKPLEAAQTEPAPFVETEQMPATSSATEGGSDELPPMDDLFASLESPMAPEQTGPEDVPSLAEDDDTTAEPYGALAPDAPVASPPVEASDISAEPETTSDETAFAPGADEVAGGEDGMATAAAELSSGLDTPAVDGSGSVVAPTTSAPGSLDTSATDPSSAPQAATETAREVLATPSSSTPDLETLVARETARDDFLLMLTKPVTVEAKDASRAASLLARLEALHSKAG
ncbi:MerR family transcriptional regulator [Shimia sp. MIT910701]|uniref:MerR family transcriptional regulator n=1 Tax=Shimia sp. MIT910701 TaxID=3096987 RepID=UPI003999ACD0